MRRSPAAHFALVPFALLAIAAAAKPARADIQISIPGATLDTTHAILAGTGCANNVDAFMAANGSDLSLVFTKLGVDLEGDGPQRADMKSCILRVPTMLPKGVYISAMHQQLGVNVSKTAGGSAGFSMVLSLFGFPVAPTSVSAPAGDVDQLLLANADDEFEVNTPWWQGWCNPGRMTNGLLQASITVHGQRRSAADTVIAFVDTDAHYDMSFDVATC
jgi:hypothetical protein